MWTCRTLYISISVLCSCEVATNVQLYCSSNMRCFIPNTENNRSNLKPGGGENSDDRVTINPRHPEISKNIQFTSVQKLKTKYLILQDFLMSLHVNKPHNVSQSIKKIYYCKSAGCQGRTRLLLLNTNRVKWVLLATGLEYLWTYFLYWNAVTNNYPLVRSINTSIDRYTCFLRPRKFDTSGNSYPVFTFTQGPTNVTSATFKFVTFLKHELKTVYVLLRSKNSIKCRVKM